MALLRVVVRRKEDGRIEERNLERRRLQLFWVPLILAGCFDRLGGALSPEVDHVYLNSILHAPAALS